MASSKIKILYLLNILNRYTDIQNQLTAEELCARMNDEYGIKAERKSVYRDIEYLREYGIDIKKGPRGYFVDEREFSVAEVRLLISAVQTAPFITATKTKNLTRKLTGKLSKNQAEMIHGQSNLGSIKFTNEEVYKTIEMINAAISSHKKISFYYYKYNVKRIDEKQHGGARYIVSPYAMIWLQDRYYLVCNVEGHDNLAHFRIDRIRGIYIEQVPWRHFSEVSQFRSRFDAAKYASYCVNMFGGEIKSVSLRCKNERVNEIFERFGDKIPIKQDSPHTFITNVDVAVSDGFYSWIAHFFGDIEITAPENVRDEYKKKISDVAKLYND